MKLRLIHESGTLDKTASKSKAGSFNKTFCKLDDGVLVIRFWVLGSGGPLVRRRSEGINESDQNHE